MAELIVTKNNFENEVLKSDKPVLLDFWAGWCGPCKMLSPIVSQISEKYDGMIKVGKVNVDEEPELANAFQVSGIPTVILFKDGKPVKKSIGFTSKENLEKMWR